MFLKTLFCLFLALQSLSAISVVAKHDIEPVDNISCRARAWVRAPDLEPGQVVQGDVKVKLDGACEDVLSYALRLRFAERSWVKTRREGVQLPERPAANRSLEALAVPKNRSIFNTDGLWTFPLRRGIKNSVWKSYEDALKDSSLWLVREEERIGFEATYDLCQGNLVTNDVVESFAILVPSTYYPPAFSPLSWSSRGGERDESGSEHIYEYIVDVAFKNGTIREVPAGYTSFSAPTVSESAQVAETVNVTVSMQPFYMREKFHKSEDADPEDVDVFILEVTFPYGRHLKQGSVNNITIVSHQIGPGIQRPARMSLNVYASQKRHWAASLAADNETAELLLRSGRNFPSQLMPKPQTGNSHSWSVNRYDSNVLLHPEFSQDGIVMNGTMFSTESITAQFHVSDDFTPSFEMYQMSSEAELQLRLEVHNTSGGDEAAFEDSEEYNWIPIMKESNYQAIQSLSGRIPLFIHSKEDNLNKAAATDNVHYLSPEARAPVFVDPASVEVLVQKSIQDRDSLSPKVQPSFNRREDGDVVKERYFVGGQPGLMCQGQYYQGRYYVGDTWLRKVVLPRKSIEAQAQANGLRIQS